MARTTNTNPLAFLGDELEALRERNLYRPLRVMTSAQGPIVSIDGQRVISLSSNDYLGLTHHPRLRQAALTTPDLGMIALELQVTEKVMRLYARMVRNGTLSPA